MGTASNWGSWWHWYWSLRKDPWLCTNLSFPSSILQRGKWLARKVTNFAWRFSMLLDSRPKPEPLATSTCGRHFFCKGASSDPADYRPISLVRTCYKLYARILAARLSAGLGSPLRKNQYRFRHGRSTSEAIFLMRRLPDLVDAKENQALFLLFLDSSKAFDTIKPAALHLALQRLRISPRMCSATRDLAAPPFFEVAVTWEISMQKKNKWHTPRLYLVTVVVHS